MTDALKLVILLAAIVGATALGLFGRDPLASKALGVLGTVITFLMFWLRT